MRSTLRSWAALGVTAIAFFAVSARGQDATEGLEWVTGPAECRIGEIGTIQLPEGYWFTGGDDARVFLERMGEPTVDTEVGLMVGPGSEWWAILDFDPVGWVEGGKGARLRSFEIMEILKQGQGEAPGPWQSGSGIEKWKVEPRYDHASRTLHYGITYYVKGMFLHRNPENIFMVRLLRRGVLRTTVVGRQGYTVADAKKVERVLATLAVIPGERHEDFRDGDVESDLELFELITGPTIRKTDWVKTIGTKVFWWLAIFVVGSLVFGWKYVGRRPDPPPAAP